MGSSSQTQVSNTNAARLLLTSASACTAEAATYPLDVIKTRLQLQGQLQANKSAAVAPAHAPQQHLGAVRMLFSVVRNEGLQGLYAGLMPAAVRHIFYSSTRLTVYEHLRNYVYAQSQGQGQGQSPVRPGVATSLLLGATSGAVGQLVAVPADLVKVRMQADMRAVASGARTQPRYKGLVDALTKITSQEGGLVGLWRGSSPAIQRAALVNLGELATYDTAKQMILSTGILSHEGPATAAGASLCSGFVAALVSTPADVVKSRVMSQDATHRHYTGTLDCAIKTVRHEGVAALWKGFWPTWARLGPWQLVFWTTYEQLRTAAGMGGF